MTTRHRTEATVRALHDAFGSAPFDVGQAETVGVGRRRLQGAVAAGKIQHLGARRYIAGPVDDREWLRRLQQDFDRRGVTAVIAGPSAAMIWSIPVLCREGARPRHIPTLWVPPTAARAGVRGGVKYGHFEVPVHHTDRTSDGLIVTSPLRTAIDVVRLARMPRRRALATLSIALRRHIALVCGFDLADEFAITQAASSGDVRAIAIESLRTILNQVPAWGATCVRRCLPLVDPRLETALEAISWGWFADAGLPMPEPQVWLTGASGRRWRVDFWWPHASLIGEADGMVKYVAQRSLWEEKERQLDLEAKGHSLARWGWQHVSHGDAIHGRDPVMGALAAKLCAA